MSRAHHGIYTPIPGGPSVPLLATLALHALVLGMLLARWEGPEQNRTIEAFKLVPDAINAKLVTIDEFKPKPKPKPARKTPPKTSRPKPARTEPARRDTTASAKPAETRPAPSETKSQPKPAAKPEPKPEPRMTAEELAAISRREFEQALAQEEAVQVAVTAEEMAASYAALIQQTVVNYWSRPPSARNGMEALLQLQLIPTGEIVSVSVLKSSGSAAFDRSAINAVEKAGSFPELKNLPANEFEKTFRRFRLLFRPEDLRY